MGDMMQADAAFLLERFLVEDVMLTLGNIQGALRWMGEPGQGQGVESLAHAIARLDHQIDGLCDRAAILCRTLPPGAGRDPPSASSPLTLAHILGDALGPDAGPTVHFRSTRALTRSTAPQSA